MKPQRRPSHVEIDSIDRLLDDFFVIEAAQLRYERFDGSMSKTVRRLSLERGDAVGVVIFNRDSQHVVLTEQFRYPAYRKGPVWMIEVVAGMIEPGADTAQTVRREVLEEVGYRLDNFESIGAFYVSPGGSSERIFLYAAEVGNHNRVARGGGLAEEGEHIRVVEMSLDEVATGLDEGFFADAKTIIGLMWLRNRYAHLLDEPGSQAE